MLFDNLEGWDGVRGRREIQEEGAIHIPMAIPGLGRSPREGNGYPLQYSGLEKSMDRGARQATVHGVTKSWTQLSH